MGMSQFIGHISVPVYALEERAFTGFRQNMLDAGPHAVSTGAGLGTDSIWAELQEDGKKGKRVYCCILGRDVLYRVAQLTGHPDAERIPHSESCT